MENMFRLFFSRNIEFEKPHKTTYNFWKVFWQQLRKLWDLFAEI